MNDSFQDTLDLVLKASNEGIWDWEVGSEEIYYSDRIYVFLGCAKGEAPNIIKHPETMLLPEDASYLENILSLVLLDEDEELFAIDCRIKRPDGEICWLRVRGVVVREGGEAVRLVGSMIDISKRKRAEEELDEERTMLRLVVDNVPVQVYFKDKHSRFTLVNKRQAEWVGCNSEMELIGKSDADFYTPIGSKHTHIDELHIMETGKPILGQIQREMWPHRPDTFVQVVKQPWYDSRGRLAGTFGVSTDVSGIVESQARLEEIALDLQAKNHSYQEELGLAREVQQALLPGNDGHWDERVACVKEFASIDSKYIPATELAGDYYDVLPIADGVVGLFICDVMGHGVRSALVVSMIRGLMEKASHHADRPARFLEKMNQGLCKILGPTDVNMFATACYLVVDFNIGTLRVCCAGHDIPLLVEKGSDRLLSCEAPKGPALGFFEEAEYTSCIFELERISEALLFTDGIYESSNKEGEDWGIERFKQSFIEVRNSDETEELDRLCAKALSWVKGKGFDDDVCLLTIRMKGAV
ncbi:SpoIIE family protein phosphatase [Rubritalea tangerina]|uniref:SpoIIE family protein phosphatase n=1 Tax=Rubritalea tangerina TaxID=430798 RepID=A0ABW4ZA63_9BACT